MVKSVYELDVYQRAYQIALVVHKKTLDFPKIEQYALADQIRRCSKSICANLAEGFAKSYKSQAEFKRFLAMALGSSEEMGVWIDFSKDLGYVDLETAKEWKEIYVTICKQLSTLMKSVSKNV